LSPGYIQAVCIQAVCSEEGFVIGVSLADPVHHLQQAVLAIFLDEEGHQAVALSIGEKRLLRVRGEGAGQALHRD
jgi:hypothetical protein